MARRRWDERLRGRKERGDGAHAVGSLLSAAVHGSAEKTCGICACSSIMAGSNADVDSHT
eukprot:6181009-Pleurochrysis_carterae.AAC.3